MMNKIIRFEVLFFTVLLLLSLTECKQNNKVFSTKKAIIKIDRFEKDLFGISLYGLQDSLPFLEKKYPDFFPLFTNKIIQIGNPGQADFSNRLLAFVSDFTIYKVKNRVNEVFPNLDNIGNQLSYAFSKFTDAFPGHSIPHIVTCISGFNQSIVITDSLVVISLDKYLGINDEFYKLLYPPVPEYMCYVMQPEKIPSDVVRAWLIGEFPYNDAKDNLLTKMIFEGRAIYCVKQLIPAIQDSLLWGYTPRQLRFCRENEKQMWTYLVEHKLLFEGNKFKMGQFINEAPFTKDFSKDSPGRSSVWIGFRIVNSYMKRNGNVSLNDLMKETDYLKILNLSRYNP
jgi:hypothetical protein